MNPKETVMAEDETRPSRVDRNRGAPSLDL